LQKKFFLSGTKEELNPSLTLGVRNQAGSQKSQQGAKQAQAVLGANDMPLPAVQTKQAEPKGEENLTLQQRLESLEKPSEGNELQQNSAGVVVPKAESLQAVLVQALHSNDNALLDSCLSSSDAILIHNTVKRLPTVHILPFLKVLVERFQSKPGQGSSLIIWIRSLLTLHTSYLITVPDLTKSLSSLYLSVDSRLGVFKQLLELSGRLDLLLSQIQTNQTFDPRENTTYYQEVESEDEQEQEEEEEEGSGSESEDLEQDEMELEGED